MGFMKASKHLDNLCRDMNGVGVTGYIEDMEKSSTTGSYYVSGWNNDYLKLKRYRYIRNQIAHENYADEDNMCSDEDTAWLEDFYQRIMNQSDPLALYHTEKNKRQTASKPTVPASTQSPQHLPNRTDNQSKHRPAGCGMFIICAIVATILLVSFFVL